MGTIKTLSFVFLAIVLWLPAHGEEVSVSVKSQKRFGQHMEHIVSAAVEDCSSEFSFFDPGSKFSSSSRLRLDCASNLAGVGEVLRASLEAVNSHGLVLEEVESIYLGRMPKQRAEKMIRFIAEQYLSKDRKIKLDYISVADFIEQSSAYEDVVSAFANYGIDLKSVEIEKLMTMQLSKLVQRGFFGEDKGFIQAFGDARVPFDAQVWFTITN